MKRRDVLICLWLAGITLGLYWQVGQFDLIYYDDPVMLKDSPAVQAGLTWAGIQWALTSVVLANWHPATNLSFLAVSQFFGNTPGAQHLANAVIHAANAVLVFLLLRRLTGARWRSAVVAAVFAWHPLRVESVAWIIERKDVLCAFFFLCSLLAYVRFAEKQANPAGHRYWTMDLGMSLLAFVLALLSKPMAVTLPFVLLLLDIWPLKRVEGFKVDVVSSPVSQDGTFSPKRLLLEKWPFFVLTLLFCVVTYRTQADAAGITSLDKLGIEARSANAVASYCAYLAKLFWPLNLAAIYPFPNRFDGTLTLLKTALLAVISIGCIGQLGRRPWLAVGWFWYLGTALPIIGLVQAGEQSMADRYTYLPLIGVVMALVWTAADAFSHSRQGRMILIMAAILIPAALAILTERQLQFWRNTVTLFEHNIVVTPENASAFFTLGLGFEHAGDTNRAIGSYHTAKMIDPGDVQNRQNLANLLLKQGHLGAAQNEYAGLLELNPNDSSAHMSLGSILAAEGHEDDYVFQLNEAVRLNPDFVEALNNLAWELATSSKEAIRDGSRAVTLALHACELTKYEKTIYLGTLGAAYAEAGKFDEAMATAQHACDLAAKNGESDLLQRNEALLERYRAHQPVRQ